MTKPHRYCLFMFQPLTQGGGAEKYFINLASNLTDSHTQVDIITLDLNFFRIYARIVKIIQDRNFIRPIDLSGRETPESIKKEMGTSKWIETSLSSLLHVLKNYQLIYVKNEILDLLILNCLGIKNLPPVIAGVHTPIIFTKTNSLYGRLHNFFYGGYIYRFLLSGIKLIHASNRFTYDFVTNTLKLPSKLIYYPYSNQALLKNLSLPSPIKFDPTKYNLAYVGRLGEQKGITILLELINRLSILKNCSFSLNVFGTGETKYENMLKDLSSHYSFLHYYGHIENKYMASILKSQNLLISPSFWEVLPFNILEAQSLGVPVVAFDIPGPQDIIINNTTGRLVSCESEFIKTVIELIKKHTSFDSQKTINNIETKFHPDSIYPQLKKLFNENAN